MVVVRKPMPPRYIAVPFISGGGVQVIQDPVLTATTVSGSQINLAIQYSGPPGAITYAFEVSNSVSGPFTPLASGTSPTFSYTGLLPSTTFFFRARVQVTDGRFSAFSTTQSATTLASPPITPTGVVATDVDSVSISITWNAVAGAGSYNLYRNAVQVATGLTGTSKVDAGLTPSTTYTYTVSAVNGSGESAQSATSSATTANQVFSGTIKFNPSPAYWQLDYNQSLSSQFTRMAALKGKCPQTRGFEIFLRWAQLETPSDPSVVPDGTAARFDGSWATGDQTVISNQRGFKLVDSFLAEAARLGCQLMVHIHAVGGGVTAGSQSSTSFPSGFAPAYTASSAYGNVTPATNGQWGAIWTNCYTPNSVSFGQYIRIWDQRVADRIAKLGLAYGARYNSNPNLETVGFYSDEMVISPDTGCTDAGLLGTLTGTNGLMAKWRGYFPNTQIRMFWNYFQSTTTMRTMLADAFIHDMSIGGPDTANEAPVSSSDPAQNSDGIYRTFTSDWVMRAMTSGLGDGGVVDSSQPNYVAMGMHGIREIEAEDTSYDAVSGTTIGNSRHIGDGILNHIVGHANLQQATHLCWFDNTFSGRAAVQTNTAHPNLCDYVSSLAQGGNVNVNGITAGISLTNQSYPAPWPR